MVVDFGDEILLPRGNVGDFAVIACDQFAADTEYWERVARDMPKGSALDLILPERYLDESENRLPVIRSAAADMLRSDRFYTVSGAIAVTRTTVYGRVRHGIVASVDLDDYEYAPGNQALIRASERTLQERIPPRVAIRESIDIELPHIMLLVDDRLGLLDKAVQSAPKTTLYDDDLRCGGGHIKGELITDRSGLDAAVDAIIAASEKARGSRLFALVGDGNHSLATAKYCHNAHPTPLNGKALVELVSVYDSGLVVEPIHRLVKVDDRRAFAAAIKSGVKGEAKTELYLGERRDEISVPQDKVEAIRAVDAFCERYVSEHGGYVEYVHGLDALDKPGHVGIAMRGIDRTELFDYVLSHGVLPKKTFSLGEAEEKRFYVEARRIK